MAINKEAYKALESVVGSEHISEDPVIREAYCSGRMGYIKDTKYELEFLGVPDCVILPGTTEEVQAIVNIANRYKVPYVPASSFWIVHCAAKVPRSMIIDLKRMNSFEIDAKNMYAVVGPGVIYSQLQEEAFGRGLYTTVPGGGSQAAVIPNMLHWGISPLNYRTGWASRRILGTEWVTPNGEIVRLGSLSSQDDPFWGEGPGPDLRGLLRGWAGWFGSLGVVTKMAVKLLPFQPERLVPVGISPDTALELPTNRIRWYNYVLPSRAALIKAMYEIGKAGISAGITKVPIMWRYLAKSKTREQFWEYWSKPGKKEEVERTHILRILIIGYTSQEQLEYEERVLSDIMAELGGEPRPTKHTDESWMKNADAVTMWALTGAFVSVEVTVDTIACADKTRAALTELKRKYTPPLMEDYGDMGWLQVSEFGHNGYVEFLTYFDPHDERLDKVDEWSFVATPKEDVRRGTYSGFMLCQSPLYLTGPAYGPNCHLWMLKIKEAFDPNNLSNPPVPENIDDYIERAEWLKPLKDW